jgi:hypothetical protein
MGKRELLLIIAFAVVGVIVYQATAPAPPAGSRNVTVGGLLEKMRRAVRGNPASAELTTTRSYPIDPAVTDLRLRLRSATITIEGEDRADVGVELLARSNGYDDAEAQSLVKQVVVKMDPAGSVMIASIQYPDPGEQRATVKLKIPSRLRVRLDESGSATVTGVAALELGMVRGTTSVTRVAGAVSGAHRFGDLAVNDVGTVKLTTQGSETKVSGARDVAMTSRGGELRIAGVTGALEIESNQADVIVEKLDVLSSPIRVNANGGTVTFKGLRSDARIDGRNTDLEVTMDRPATVAIYNEGTEDIVLTPPPGGYKLDALVREGRLTPPDLIAKLGLTPVSNDESKEVRANGAVGGGGPTITLRAMRGDIVLRSRGVEKTEDK